MFNKVTEAVLRWLLNLSVILSRFVNVFIFFGSPNETVEGRAWRHRHSRVGGMAVVVLDAIFFFDDDHCRSAHVADVLLAKSFVDTVEG
jgi:hypothetical protein